MTKWEYCQLHLFSDINKQQSLTVLYASNPTQAELIPLEDNPASSGKKPAGAEIDGEEIDLSWMFLDLNPPSATYTVMRTLHRLGSEGWEVFQTDGAHWYLKRAIED